MSAPAFRAMAEFAATRHGVIVRNLAASFGLTHYDIRAAKQRGWITEPVRGVLVISGYPSTWEQRLAIVIASSTAQPVVSNGAAARSFGLDTFKTAPPEIAVQRPGRISPMVAAGVIVHQTAVLEPADRYLCNGLPCTSLARTLCDLGSTESPDRVWQALISARQLHRVNPTWLQQTAVRVHRPGQTGTGVLLAALHRWSSEGTLPDSWFEELVRRLLDHPEIPPMQSQFVLNDARGKFVARLDLAIPAARLGIEAHSRRFHFGPIDEPHDEDRDLRAAAVGWELVYLGWYAQRRPAEIAALIAQTCRARLQLQRSA